MYFSIQLRAKFLFSFTGALLSAGVLASLSSVAWCQPSPLDSGDFSSGLSPLESLHSDNNLNLADEKGITYSPEELEQWLRNPHQYSQRWNPSTTAEEPSDATPLPCPPLEKGDIVFWKQNLASKKGMRRADYFGRYIVCKGQYLTDNFWNKHVDHAYTANHVSIYAGDDTFMDTGVGAGVTSADGEVRIMTADHPEIKLQGDARQYEVYRFSGEMNWIARRAVSIGRRFQKENSASGLMKSWGCAKTGAIHLYSRGATTFPDTHEQIKRYYENYRDFLRYGGKRIDRNFYCSEFIARIFQLAAIDFHLIHKRGYSSHFIEHSIENLSSEILNDAIAHIAFTFDPAYVKPSDFYRFLLNSNWPDGMRKIEYPYSK